MEKNKKEMLKKAVLSCIPFDVSASDVLQIPAFADHTPAKPHEIGATIGEVAQELYGSAPLSREIIDVGEIMGWLANESGLVSRAEKRMCHYSKKLVHAFYCKPTSRIAVFDICEPNATTPQSDE